MNKYQFVADYEWTALKNQHKTDSLYDIFSKLSI